MSVYGVITDRKIQVALVGCGRISKNHLQAIEDNKEDLELIAVCETNKEILRNQIKVLGVNGYTDLEDMLQNENIDLVVLCTPSGLHPKQAILCSKYRVHVVTEKPMATRWQDALDMVKACEDAKVRLFVVKQNRNNETIKILKRALVEKRFGKIHLIQMNVFWTRPQSYYDQGNGWRGTWDLDGGAFMNQASHYFDLLSWLIGPVEKVQAITTTTRDIEVEDTGVVNLKWRNGALGSVAITMLTYPKNQEGSITILGETGTARISGVAVNEIDIWNFSDEKDYDQTISDLNYQPASVYGSGHMLYYENVVDVLRGKAEPKTDGKEGLKTLEILIAAYLSARDTETVSLPLEY